jgi:hypothetical protein
LANIALLGDAALADIALPGDDALLADIALWGNDALLADVALLDVALLDAALLAATLLADVALLDAALLAATLLADAALLDAALLAATLLADAALLAATLLADVALLAATLPALAGVPSSSLLLLRRHVHPNRRNILRCLRDRFERKSKEARICKHQRGGQRPSEFMRHSFHLTFPPPDPKKAAAHDRQRPIIQATDRSGDRGSR